MLRTKCLWSFFCSFTFYLFFLGGGGEGIILIWILHRKGFITLSTDPFVPFLKYLQSQISYCRRNWFFWRIFETYWLEELLVENFVWHRKFCPPIKFKASSSTNLTRWKILKPINFKLTHKTIKLQIKFFLLNRFNHSSTGSGCKK